MRHVLRAAAGRLLGRGLDASFGRHVERSLPWLGHRLPDYFPGLGVVIEQLAARHDGAPLVATLSDGLQLRVPATSDGWALYLHGRLSREDEGLTHLLRHFLRADDVFFDVGANFGYYTCTAARRCAPGGQVHSFEPQAPLVAFIRESLRLNDFDGPLGVRVCRAAVSAQHGGTVPLFFARDKVRYTHVPSLFRHEWLADGSCEDVPAVSLDGYVRDQGIERVDLIKLDVEGAELTVLEGLRDTLARMPPDAVVTEVLPRLARFSEIDAGRPLRPNPESVRAHDVAALLAEYGYAPHHLTARGLMGAPFTLADMDQVTLATNVLFVRPDIQARRPGIVTTTRRR